MIRTICPILSLGFALILTGCASVSLPTIGKIESAGEIEPVVTATSDGYAHTDLTVMTYNIAGLPWPMMKDRDASLSQIGSDLADMRAKGTAPDIVLIQEGFRSGTKALIEAANYPYWAKGPSRKDKPNLDRLRTSPAFISKRKFTKAEKIGKLLDSGLYILSEYPITTRIVEPFGKYECAGYDCAANKGALWVEIAVPNLPEPLQVFTLHLNARKAAKVPKARSLEAHNAQFEHLAEFVESQWDPSIPLLFGGDFNLSHSEARWNYMNNYDDGLSPSPERDNKLTMPYCRESKTCVINADGVLDKDPTTFQDWQGFSSGKRLHIEPTELHYDFAGPDPRGFTIRGKPTLSDHAALTVTYDISWKLEGLAAGE